VKSFLKKSFHEAESLPPRDTIDTRGRKSDYHGQSLIVLTTAADYMASNG